MIWRYNMNEKIESIEIKVGDFVEGFAITKITKDPFKEDTIDLYSNAMKHDTFGNLHQVIFHITKGESK